MSSSRLTRIFKTPAMLLAAIALGACGTSDGDNRVPLTPETAASGSGDAGTPAPPALAADAAAAIDAGNSAYRARKFDVALVKYREAATLAPKHAAPWFGLYMVASELKQAALADSAMARVKALSTDPAALGAHAEVATATMPVDHAAQSKLPPGHPAPKAAPGGSPSSIQALPPGHPTPKTEARPLTKRGAGGA